MATDKERLEEANKRIKTLEENIEVLKELSLSQKQKYEDKLFRLRNRSLFEKILWIFGITE